MKVRYHKGTLSFLGSRQLNNTGRRLNYSQPELFWPHMQIRRLQNPQTTMWLQKQNNHRLPSHSIQGHLFCPTWWKKKTCQYRRGDQVWKQAEKKKLYTLLDKIQAPKPTNSKIYCTFKIYIILSRNQVQGNGKRICTDGTIIWPTYGNKTE